MISVRREQSFQKMARVSRSLTPAAGVDPPLRTITTVYARVASRSRTRQSASPSDPRRLFRLQLSRPRLTQLDFERTASTTLLTLHDAAVGYEAADDPYTEAPELRSLQGEFLLSVLLEPAKLTPPLGAIRSRSKNVCSATRAQQAVRAASRKGSSQFEATGCLVDSVRMLTELDGLVLF